MSVNITYPAKRTDLIFPDGINELIVQDELEAIMVKYFVLPNGEFDYYAFMVGRIWCEYFKLHATSIAVALLPGKPIPSAGIENTLVGIEGPLFDLPYNPFWQKHSYRIGSVIQTEVGRAHNIRSVASENPELALNLSHVRWDFVSTIAGCCRDFQWEKECMVAVKLHTDKMMRLFIDSVKSKTGAGAE